MFPGCTLLDLRARHEDLLREASRERMQRNWRRLPDGQDAFIYRFVVQCVAALLAMFGL